MIRPLRFDETRSVAPPNDSAGKLRTASHTSGDAARPLPRLTLAWQEQPATDVTPSHISNAGAEAPYQGIGGSTASPACWAAVYERLLRSLYSVDDVLRPRADLPPVAGAANSHECHVRSSKRRREDAAPTFEGKLDARFRRNLGRRGTRAWRWRRHARGIPGATLVMRGESVVRPTDHPISCARPPHATCDAARQLPRLTIALAEAICNCRDAVARMSKRRFSAGPANGRASTALGSWVAVTRACDQLLCDVDCGLRLVAPMSPVAGAANSRDCHVRRRKRRREDAASMFAGTTVAQFRRETFAVAEREPGAGAATSTACRKGVRDARRKRGPPNGQPNQLRAATARHERRGAAVAAPNNCIGRSDLQLT